jgi:hypothetical protein
MGRPTTRQSSELYLLGRRQLRLRVVSARLSEKK